MLSRQKLTAFVRSKGFQILLISFAILALIPVLIRDSFFLFVFTLIFIFAIYAASWNFLTNSGQGSLGHAAFLGIGGFASAIIGSRLSVAIITASKLESMPIGALSVFLQIFVLLLGGLLSAGIGLLIGLACVRLKAWYLAMVTFGFSVIANTLSSQFDSFTNGINGFAPATFVPSGFPFYILVISFAVISIGVMYAVMKSRMGLAFRAIHGNEAEARMIGINTAKYKLIAFTISTFFAGIAGGLYVYFIRFVDNSIFSPTNSFLPLIMSVIGGLGTVSGPVIGSIFLTSIGQILTTQPVTQGLSNTLGPFFPKVGYVGPPLTYLFIGVILIVIVVFSPKGLESLFRKFYKYLIS
ncbi:MAG: branched-chain amino acid ABC transporter permease [Candidatus Bathyarchaeia archaeon]|jgi:branched-chain amino acid transport system permease protein